MPSNVISRKTVREALATLIDAGFDSTWDVFNYKTKKFNGKARNIVVASAGSKRDKTGSRQVDSDTQFRFRIFVFVLYAVQPFVATNSPTAGVNKPITLTSTTNLINGATVRIEDDSNSEDAVINTLVLNTSIQIATLVNSYTTPRVYAWTDHNSDDQLDAAEKAITDICNDNRKNNATATLWGELELGEWTDPDLIVDEAGQTYRREIINVTTTKLS